MFQGEHKKDSTVPGGGGHQERGRPPPPAPLLRPRTVQEFRSRPVSLLDNPRDRQDVHSLDNILNVHLLDIIREFYSFQPRRRVFRRVIEICRNERDGLVFVGFEVRDAFVVGCQESGDDL